MKILAIDTSCDETAAAVTEGRKVLSNVIYSQVLVHKSWGGVVPSLAKRAHEERIDYVVSEAVRKAFRVENFSPSELASLKEEAQTSTRIQNFQHFFSQIDVIAVTQGPGLAIALEVGIQKAKELAEKYKKPLIAVNHMEGHIYSSFVQNSKGNPSYDFEFPYLALLVSGSHTELVLFKDHISYEVIGKSVDDAGGEAIDKAARMIGFGYPGGPTLERLALDVKNKDFYKFPRPMSHSGDLNFSFSGLKTSFFYYIRKLSEEEKNKNLKELASSYQEAVFDCLIIKTEKAMKQTGIKKLVVGGGVIANKRLRNLLRALVKKYNGSVLFPPYPYLTGDNAAMIGVAAHFKAEKKMYMQDLSTLDRIPRLSL
ncbi:MAG: tRNA (adenosine(37)-N6)-threonylcarbamoyltransferase complex transferase subunit TsaD [bacterium]|nr:tRNA (adenosine(37)-N6)-threonylcarbamoyltransferase complex transferase subunit TsaD [bacterium]